MNTQYIFLVQYITNWHYIIPSVLFYYKINGSNVDQTTQAFNLITVPKEDSNYFDCIFNINVQWVKPCVYCPFRRNWFDIITNIDQLMFYYCDSGEQRAYYHCNIILSAVVLVHTYIVLLDGNSKRVDTKQCPYNYQNNCIHYPYEI